MSAEIGDLLPEAETHYWHPIPQPDGRRHAFRGARRWPGQSSGETVCGATVAMARVSEMDWVYLPTCGFCWAVLIEQQRSRDTPNRHDASPKGPSRSPEARRHERA